MVIIAYDNSFRSWHQFGANSVFEAMITYREMDHSEINFWHFNYSCQSEYWAERQPIIPGLGLKWVNN